MYGSGKPDDNPFATSVGGPPAYRDELDEIALTGTSTGAGAWGSPGVLPVKFQESSSFADGI